jgi:hypothetical protein
MKENTTVEEKLKMEEHLKMDKILNLSDQYYYNIGVEFLFCK